MNLTRLPVPSIGPLVCDLRATEAAHFKALVENLRKRSGEWGRRVADLIECLAYSEFTQTRFR